MTEHADEQALEIPEHWHQHSALDLAELLLRGFEKSLEVIEDLNEQIAEASARLGRPQQVQSLVTAQRIAYHIRVRLVELRDEDG